MTFQAELAFQLNKTDSRAGLTVGEGLFLAEMIIQKHNGQLVITNHETGTILQFALPRAAEPC